jgi:hydrogenase nickel incorporation protein HypA/HybF
VHERSLAATLLKQVEAHAAAHQAARVTEVCVRIGPLAGVEPQLLGSAFQELAEKSDAAGALLRLEEVALLARCLDCGHEFEVEEFRFACPVCASGSTHLLQGDAVVLESITVADTAVETSETAQV